MRSPRAFIQTIGVSFLGIGVLALSITNSAFGQDRSQPETSHVASELRTVAETTNYQATATGRDVELFLKRLDRTWDAAKLESLGTTVEGRTIWGLVVEPSAKTTAKPLTVLLLGGIHSGECDGKEALLTLAREFALGGHTAWSKSLRLIFVPNFNADGNERVGKDHRPGQAGPEQGMGIRENAQGLDLNRDFVKLETPEVRSLVAALTKFDVDVLIDAHTTNGSMHRYDLTYDIAHNPATPRSIDNWLRDKFLPSVTESLEKAGLPTFFYGNFDKPHAQWQTYGFEPRYSTEMMGLRGKIGILVESYSYASYQRRIEASAMFIREVLKRLATEQNDVRAMIDAAAVEVKLGHALPVRAALAQTAESVTVRGYQTSAGEPPTPPYDSKSSASLKPKDYQVQLWASAKSTQDVRLPAAYAIDPQYAWAVSRLQFHGIRLQRLKSSLASLSTETYQVTKVDSSEPFQGHARRTITAEVKQSNADLKAGTYIVAADQPLGMLAAYLLEPTSDDGLAAWNFFDPYVTAGSPFPVVRLTQVIEPAALSSVEEVARGERMAFDHIMRPGKTVEYASASPSGATWLEGTDDLLMRREREWLLVDPATGASRPFERLSAFVKALSGLEAFKAEDARQRATPAALSRDGRFGLVTHKNDVFFFDATSGQARQLTHSPKEPEELAELSPTGKHVVYVRDNNLWIVDTQSTEERQLTSNGSTELLNGILDWVYQEELYGRGNFKGFWISPDGAKLAYLQLDQTPVLHYQVPDSTSVRQTLEDTRYPKAGDPIPAARMWIVDIATGKQQEVNLNEFPIEDRLVVRITWSPTNELWLQIQNRVQTEQRVVHIDPTHGAVEVALEEKSPGWIEVLSEPRFLPSGDFLWLSDLPAGRRHLFRWDKKSRKLVSLTSGDWDVAEIVAVPEDGKHALVTANISHPCELQLLSVDAHTGAVEQLTKQAGTHRPKVSASGQFFLDTFTSLDQPPTTSLKSVNGTVSRVLSASISDRHRYLDISEPNLFTIPARDGLPLQSMVLLPPGVDAKNPNAKLPVLFHVYGGPQAPTVNNSWQGGNYWWHQYLCQQGYAVVLCDNRAARGRGIADTWKIHRDLGRVELMDLEDAAAWVSSQPWADAERLGVWGWSYGGYFTAYAMTHSQLFKAGIAGAPVTDWQNYDAIYTERYMGLPKDNPDGYKSSSTVTAAKDIHGRLLIIHGERDDNVHMSNTLQLANALQRAGKPFDMMIYPKNRHGVVEPTQRFHLYQMMTEFLGRNLK